MVVILVKKRCQLESRGGDTKLIMETTEQPHLPSLSTSSLLHSTTSFRNNVRISEGSLEHLEGGQDVGLQLELSPSESLVLDEISNHPRGLDGTLRKHRRYRILVTKHFGISRKTRG